jgi:AbrB family looped-hinge helix DNA binding protein
MRMAIAQSKVTAQGQISVPVEVRKKLGVGPGSVLEWDEQGDQVVVRRAGRYSSEQIHQAIFPEKELRQKSVDVKVGIRKYIRKRHARD